MPNVSPFWDALSKLNIKVSPDSRAKQKSGLPSWQVMTEEDGKKIQATISKLKVKHEMFDAGSGYSGKYTSYVINDKGDKFVLVMRYGKVAAKQFTPAAFGMNGKTYRTLAALVKDSREKISKSNGITPEVKKVLLHMINLITGEQKYDPKIFMLVDDKTLATIRNDFGEIAAAMDSLKQKKKYIKFSSESNSATVDYYEEDVGLAVKSGKSETDFGSGNTLTNLKNELVKYKPKDATEKILHEGFSHISNRKIYDALFFFSKHLPYMKKLYAQCKKMGYGNMDEGQFKKFVADHSKMKNSMLYNQLPQTKYGLAANKLNQACDWDSIMFFFLTNLNFDLNAKWSKEINIIAQKLFKMKDGAVKVIIMNQKDGMMFMTANYDKFTIKFHYWANAGAAMNNWPGFKVVKK